MTLAQYSTRYYTHQRTGTTVCLVFSGATRFIFIFSLMFWCGQHKMDAQSLDKVKVTKFENLTRKCSTELMLGDYIRFTVDSLTNIIRKKPAGAKIVLYINQVPFEDLEPEFIDSKGTLTFHFQRNPEPAQTSGGTTVATASKAWIFFYKKPREHVLRGLKISIGYTGGSAFASDKTIDLVIIHTYWFIVGLILILALTAIFLSLAILSNLLKDSGSLHFRSRPFSIARTQFTFWLLIIASAYVFLWSSTGEMPELTQSCLILLGISGSTSIIAKVIDNSQSMRLRHQDQPSQGFLTDLLSDDNGVSVHRLQILVFTLVLAVIFVHDVIVFFELPNFDSNLLLLMGISSGAYAGFKTTENSSSSDVG